MKISEILYSNSTINNVNVADKDDLFKFLSKLLSRSIPNSDSNLIFKSLQNREKLGNTGIGNGVAIPHARFSGISVPVSCFVRLERPILYDANDSQPVDLCFGLLIPSENITQNVEIFSTLAKKLGDEDLQEKLREAKTDDDLYQIIVRTKV